MVTVQRFRHIDANRADEFVRLGHQRRHFFPHRVYYVPKCGPDGFKLATRMCGPCRLHENWEMLLYASPALAAQFPSEVFFDDALVWHQQQFGRVGLVATTNMLLRGDALHTMVLQADIVQRAARCPEHRTQLQKRFCGWHRLALNAVLNFALERNVRTVYVPTTALALVHTDRNRRVGPALFERVYDANVQGFCEASRDGDWWRIDVRQNAGRVLRAAPGDETVPYGKTICVCHDIEGGLGHREVDPALSVSASQARDAHLSHMLEAEAAVGLRATYHCVGELMDEVRGSIEAERHCLGFHSYDHRLDGDAPQLPRCRNVDYRIKGYRPPASIFSAELTRENLAFHNFEWLASSAHSFGFTSPRLCDGLVEVPIAFDDFHMYRDGMTFETWQAHALNAIEASDFVAFSLHDCYADRWLPRYHEFLRSIRMMGAFSTLDQVAARLVLQHAA
jgi:hypothetical protein